jgi:Leucine-rich repeat (LRR) protein
MLTLGKRLYNRWYFMSDERDIRLSNLKSFKGPDRIFLEDIRPLFANKKNIFTADSSDKPWFVKGLFFCNNENLVIPESIKKLTHLEDMGFVSNPGLNNMPEIIRQCTTLKYMRISGKTSINILPEWIGEFSNLNFLVLDRLTISSIPESIKYCVQLKKLKLENVMEMESLPDLIGNLTQLETIDIDDTPLESVPKSLIKLNNLTRFHLVGTQIARIPWQVGWLPHLEYFAMGQQKFEDETMELLEKYTPHEKSVNNPNKIKEFQAEVRRIYPPPPEFAETLIEP